MLRQIIIAAIKLMRARAQHSLHRIDISRAMLVIELFSVKALRILSFADWEIQQYLLTKSD